MSKDLWINEYEAISEDFVGGMCDEDTARQRMKALGFDQDETADHINALKDEIAEQDCLPA